MIHAEPFTVTLKDVWTIARNSSHSKTNVRVTLQRDGIVGYGEAAPNVRYGETAELTCEHIRRVAEAVERLDWRCFRQVKAVLDTHIVGQSCAKAAVDIAVMDWAAKRMGVPLYRLFGLDPAQTPITSFSIGIDTPERVQEKTRQAAAYPILKIKLGSPGDRELITAVRRVTDKPIRVDANEGWTDKEQAVRTIAWLQAQNVAFIEQPMPAAMLDETAWLRQRVELPLVADEAVLTAADIPALAGVYDGVNIKLMKAGGLQEAVAMIHTARAAGLKVMLGCMIESSVAIAAAAHISPLADWADLDGNLLIGDDPFVGVGVIDGKLTLNDQPGLGVGARERI